MKVLIKYVSPTIFRSNKMHVPPVVFVCFHVVVDCVGSNCTNKPNSIKATIL